MKKIFIIIISSMILVIGVYYLAANNSAAQGGRAANVSTAPQGGYSSSQPKSSISLPALRQSPSARTRVS